MTVLLERSKLSNEDLRRMFDDLRASYNGDFALAFLALHLEAENRIAQLELQIAKLEAKRR